ncbi:hypothetical protein EJ03DRAFT_351925 [Teratosphaeria nubilosa]|uniref:FAD dependent oxidoreductase domain-containing protein n=1 Tax=Teratosphaeria nubilosa TaxID=161662 RepID=A0A6G1L791_9PEZI|nr:hypothetical protein EJ03DRAFT_351925 [Teratosphaeria nubilosa]
MVLRRAPGMVSFSQPEVPPEDVHTGKPTHTQRWGYPTPDGYSLSYWLQQVRSDPLLNHRSSPELPTKVDCVVIGSDHRLSYGVLLPDGGLFSINSRCTSDGLVMFGGDNPGQMKLNEWVEQHPETCVDDSMANVPEVENAVRSFAEAELLDWDDGVQMGPGQGYDYNWSGIIALTSDGVPFVGEVPGKPGQWACVGHNGHGMARTFTLAPGLAKLIAGHSWESTGIPEAFSAD